MYRIGCTIAHSPTRPFAEVFQVLPGITLMYYRHIKDHIGRPEIKSPEMLSIEIIEIF